MIYASGNSGGTVDAPAFGTLAPAGGASVFPYFSLPVTVTVPANNEMVLHGRVITVEIYRENAGAAPPTLLNSVDVNFDTVALPIPRLSTNQGHWAFHRVGPFGNSNPVGRFAPGASGLVHTGQHVMAGDTVQTYVLPHGDNRLMFGGLAGRKQFQPVPAPPGGSGALRHLLADFPAAVELPPERYPGTTLFPGNSFAWRGHWTPVLFPPASYPAGIPAPWTFGDWDTGSPFRSTDGPLINKPDEGNFVTQLTRNPYSTEYAGHNTEQNAVVGTHYHTANRQISSPVMFGSLPTGMVSGQPWQTLLFRPDPGGHPGAADPPDHLWLDLFWMPVVEPYAISEPFSTAGKVNMNYQMIPFTYIHRATGMHAILKNESIYAVPENVWSDGYGKMTVGSLATAPEFVRSLDVNETLVPFRQKFARGEIFLTPSEITEGYLVPEGERYSDMEAFWARHRLTGENLRERPYATVYPRLTTCSNVFNLHYRVQTLRKRPGSVPDIWEEGWDHQVAELRGNTVFERYLDMNRGDLPDFALPENDELTAESFYRYRVLSTQSFTP